MIRLANELSPPLDLFLMYVGALKIVFYSVLSIVLVSLSLTPIECYLGGVLSTNKSPSFGYERILCDEIGVPYGLKFIELICYFWQKY